MKLATIWVWPCLPTCATAHAMHGVIAGSNTPAIERGPSFLRSSFLIDHPISTIINLC